MKTVYKYELPKVDKSIDVALPFNPGFLCVQVQQGQPVAYVQVDTTISGTNPWRFTAVANHSPGTNAGSSGPQTGLVRDPNNRRRGLV